MRVPERYARSRDVESTRVGDRAVLYHRGSRTAVVLNPTGSWIWGELTEPQTACALAQRLQARFPALPHDQALRDVSGLLEELLTHQVISAGE